MTLLLIYPQRDEPETAVEAWVRALRLSESQVKAGEAFLSQGEIMLLLCLALYTSPRSHKPIVFNSRIWMTTVS
jgi:hypothetical protein